MTLGLGVQRIFVAPKRQEDGERLALPKTRRMTKKVKQLLAKQRAAVLVPAAPAKIATRWIPWPPIRRVVLANHRPVATKRPDGTVWRLRVVGARANRRMMRSRQIRARPDAGILIQHRAKTGEAVKNTRIGAVPRLQ